jgi:hypothetical protein
MVLDRNMLVHERLRQNIRQRRRSPHWCHAWALSWDSPWHFSPPLHTKTEAKQTSEEEIPPLVPCMGPILGLPATFLSSPSHIVLYSEKMMWQKSYLRLSSRRSIKVKKKIKTSFSYFAELKLKNDSSWKIPKIIKNKGNDS